MSQGVSGDGLRRVLLAVGVLAGFVLLVVLSLTYIAQTYSALYACGCAYTLPVVIVLLACAGIVAGVLIFYFLSGIYSRQQQRIKRSARSALSFLPSDERQLVRLLVEKDGVPQSSLDRGMGRVRVFRALKRLEEKGIVKRERKGRTYSVSLKDDIKDLLG
jgi:uncharacterized membrane protein